MMYKSWNFGERCNEKPRQENGDKRQLKTDQAFLIAQLKVDIKDEADKVFRYLEVLMKNDAL